MAGRKSPAPGPQSPPSPTSQVSCQPVGWLSCTLRESRAGGLIFALLPRQFSSLRMPKGCVEGGRKIQRFPVGHFVIRGFVLGIGPGKWGQSRRVSTLPKSTQPVSSPAVSAPSLLNSQTHSVLICLPPRNHFTLVD